MKKRYRMPIRNAGSCFETNCCLGIALSLAVDSCETLIQRWVGIMIRKAEATKRDEVLIWHEIFFYYSLNLET